MDIYRGYPDRSAGGEAAAADLAGKRPAFSNAIPAWG